MIISHWQNLHQLILIISSKLAIIIINNLELFLRIINNNLLGFFLMCVPKTSALPAPMMLPGPKLSNPQRSNISYLNLVSMTLEGKCWTTKHPGLMTQVLFYYFYCYVAWFIVLTFTCCAYHSFSLTPLRHFTYYYAGTTYTALYSWVYLRCSHWSATLRLYLISTDITYTQTLSHSQCLHVLVNSGLSFTKEQVTLSAYCNGCWNWAQVWASSSSKGTLC